MDIDDLIKMYKEKKERYGEQAYKHISELLKEAKGKQRNDFLKSEQAQQTRNEGNVPDPEQSWRAFKGKNLEKLLLYITKDCICDLGLEIVIGSMLEKSSNTLSEKLTKVKRNLLVDFGEYGCHLPDADLIIYNPRSCDIIAILSIKVTLRERVAQTGYWKLKLKENELTKNIKVLFITLDEDSTLTLKKYMKKGRAIAEQDTDGTYVLTTDKLEESSKVKSFEKFIDDIATMNNSFT